MNLYQRFKQASRQDLIEKKKSFFERICSVCQKVQPEGNGINQPCACGNDVVMVIPTEEAK